MVQIEAVILSRDAIDLLYLHTYLSYPPEIVEQVIADDNETWEVFFDNLKGFLTGLYIPSYYLQENKEVHLKYESAIKDVERLARNRWSKYPFSHTSMPRISYVHDKLKGLTVLQLLDIESQKLKVDGPVVGLIGTHYGRCMLEDKDFKCSYRTKECETTLYINTIDSIVPRIGLGTRLLEELRKLNSSSTVKRINIHSYGNSPSSQLMQSFGFTRVGQLKGIYKDGADCDLNCLFLD